MEFRKSNLVVWVFLLIIVDSIKVLTDSYNRDIEICYVCVCLIPMCVIEVASVTQRWVSQVLGIGYSKLNVSLGFSICPNSANEVKSDSFVVSMTGLRSIIVVSSPVMYAGADRLTLGSEFERSGLGVSAAHLHPESWLEVTTRPEFVSSSLDLSKTAAFATDHVGRTGRDSLSDVHVSVETTVFS